MGECKIPGPACGTLDPSTEKGTANKQHSQPPGPIGVQPVIDSPCNRVCTLDPRSGLCLGCGRSLDEIARWTQMTDAERARIVAELDGRSTVRRPI